MEQKQTLDIVGEEIRKQIGPSLKPSPGRGIMFDPTKNFAYQLNKGLRKPGRISFDVLRRASFSVHIARICINVLKEKVSKTEWVIKPLDPKKPVDEKKQKELTDFFKHPTKNSETFRTLMDKILEDLLVLDAISLEKTRYPDGKLAEVHYVDAASVRPVFDEYGAQDIKIPLFTEQGEADLPVSYVQVLFSSQYGGPESGDIVAAWPKKDFIYTSMHPQGAMDKFGYGMSPLESVLSVVANILNADNYNGTYFEEGSMPPMILQMVGKMNQRDLEAMREYLYQELQGSFHRPALFAGTQKIEAINLKGNTNKDMEFMEYMKFMARLMAAAYGLSGQDIGLTDDLNKAIAEVQKDLSAAKGYGSILHLLKEIFNQEIVWKDFGYEEFEFDWVAPDTTDPKDAMAIYDTALKNGTLTVNEVREKMGEVTYDDWADKPLILTATGYIPASQMAPPPLEGGDGLAGPPTLPPEHDQKEAGLPEETADVVGGEQPYQDQAEQEIHKSGKFRVGDIVGFEGKKWDIVSEGRDEEGVIVYDIEQVDSTRRIEGVDEDELERLREPDWMRGKSIRKSVFTDDGYKTFLDDRGYSQPFIYMDIIREEGMVVKPPVAVNLQSQDMEVELSKKLVKAGVNVPAVQKMTYADVVNKLLPTEMVKQEFENYLAMTPAYDSEKWRVKMGGGRKYPYYLVQKFINGRSLRDPLLLEDMRRDPESYAKAIKDLAKLWKIEKEMILGDRRADQYIIDKSKRAWGFDYQFAGDIYRWKDTSNSLNNVLLAVPVLQKYFADLISQKPMVKRIKDIFKAAFTNQPIQSPQQSFEEVPVMFGELITDNLLKQNVQNLFKHNATKLLIEYGFVEDSFVYDFNQAVNRLEEFVKNNPKGYGGVLTLGDITGKKYYVYVKESTL